MQKQPNILIQKIEVNVEYIVPTGYLVREVQQGKVEDSFYAVLVKAPAEPKIATIPKTA